MTQTAEKPWDFRDALELLGSAPRDTADRARPTVPIPISAPVSASDPEANLPIHGTGHLPGLDTAKQLGLGDFATIWRFLDISSSLPTRTTTIAPELAHEDAARHAEYISDGAYAGRSSATKSIQWRDHVDDGSLTDIAPDTSATEDDSLVKKSLGKKGRAGNGKFARPPHRDPESESELPWDRKTPARKASVHALNAPSKAAAASTKSKYPKIDNVRKNLIQTYLREQYCYNPSAGKTSPAPTGKSKDPVAVPASSSTLVEPEQAALQLSEQQSPSVGKKEWPVSGATREKINSSSEIVDNSRQYRRDVIKPRIIRSGEDRHWTFLLKLIEDFYPDRGSLVRPANLTTHSMDPKGIHVFVDASNIFIGFHDQLKRARGIPATARVPRVDMSFDSLALLMERRRPVAKRVLCGSTPHVAAFDVAKAIGYECSILDKVFKARELTERQRYFYERENSTKARRRSSVGNASNTNSGSDSNAPITTPTHAPSRMVEQGVDEILHLKILETLVDNDEPSTIVLATGDAAQAEYSQGFMVMVERALRKGWSVELVSWKSNISQMYRKAAFVNTWKDKFRIIELDAYAEELLDM